jgi:hypothetical protein
MVKVEVVGEDYSRAETGEKRSSRPNGVAGPVKMMVECRRDMYAVVVKLGLRLVMDVSER